MTSPSPSEDADAASSDVDAVIRTLELLWESPEDRPVGRTGLSRETIVEAAVTIADADGIDAVTMRSVAKALGSAAMSLYRHVPGKDELLALMVDQVTRGSVPEIEGTDWREDLRRVAQAEWDLGWRHPWMVQVTNARVVAGPGTVASFEAALAAAASTGLPPHQVMTVVWSLLHLVTGAVRTAVEAAELTARTGIDEAAWWEAQSEVLAANLDEERTPVLLRMLDAHVLQGLDEDPIAELHRALELLLDGVQLEIDAHDG